MRRDDPQFLAAHRGVRAILESHGCHFRNDTISTLVEAVLCARPVDAAPAAIESQQTFSVAPIPMVLYCPECGLQHIDAPEDAECDGEVVQSPGWSNPPHRSHLCHGCGHIWRPADVPTTGVAAVWTQGKNDSPIAVCTVSRRDVDASVAPHAKPVDAMRMDAEAWSELHRLRAERGPTDGGYATWKEAAVAERARRVELERSAVAVTPGNERATFERLVLQALERLLPVGEQSVPSDLNAGLRADIRDWLWRNAFNPS